MTIESLLDPKISWPAVAVALLTLVSLLVSLATKAVEYKTAKLAIPLQSAAAIELRPPVPHQSRFQLLVQLVVFVVSMAALLFFAGIASPSVAMSQRDGFLIALILANVVLSTRKA